MKVYAITTIDNPYHPLDQFTEWFNYDVLAGYNSLAYVARVANFADNFTDEENQTQLSYAIDEIIEIDPFGIYLKVEQDFEE